MSDAKVVVVTGASKGLGLVVAGEFASNGWRVVGTGRSEQPAEFPSAAVYRQLDAGSAEECMAFWQWLKETYADAEICLVNNAGVYAAGTLLETSADEYARQMHGNFFAAVYMMRAMAETIQKARIVNVISSSALKAHKDNSAYGASKAAAAHFFQSLQQEFAPAQYQVTNLYPSDIASHGPAPNAIASEDLAAFIRELAENGRSYYLRDVSMYPSR